MTRYQLHHGRKRSEETEAKGRTIRKVIGGGGGMGDFQLARFFF